MVANNDRRYRNRNGGTKRSKKSYNSDIVSTYNLVILSLQARKTQNPKIHKYHPSLPFLKPQTKKETKEHCKSSVLFWKKGCSFEKKAV